MEPQEYRGAWHGNPAIKARTVEKMRRHRERDEFIAGEYQQLDPDAAEGYKGCALGCMVDRQDELNISNPLANAFEIYQSVARELGFPHDIAEAIDETFESTQSFQDAADFAVAVVEVTPVGADFINYRRSELEEVTGRPVAFVSWLSRRPVAEVPDAQATA